MNKIIDLVLFIYIFLRGIMSFLLTLPWRLLGLHIGKHVTMGLGCWFSPFQLRYISIEDDVFIKENCTFHSLASPNMRTYGSIVIGKGTHINKNASIVANKKIMIGKNCLFGINVSLFDHDHVFSKNLHPTQSGLTQGKPIIIGNDVYLGNNVVVLKGVTLGNHVVVGANSVVTKSFPSNVIIAGAPAKIIGQLH